MFSLLWTDDTSFLSLRETTIYTLNLITELRVLNAECIVSFPWILILCRHNETAIESVWSTMNISFHHHLCLHYHHHDNDDNDDSCMIKTLDESLQTQETMGYSDTSRVSLDELSLFPWQVYEPYYEINKTWKRDNEMSIWLKWRHERRERNADRRVMISM